MPLPDVITDVTTLSVRDLVSMTGIPPSVWTEAVSAGKLGKPFLKSGAWQIRAQAAVRFLRETQQQIPGALEGVDRTCLVYHPGANPDPGAEDRTLLTLQSLTKVLEVYAADTVFHALWLCGRMLPKTVVLPLSFDGVMASRVILERCRQAVVVLIGDPLPGSAAANAKAFAPRNGILYLPTTELGPIARLLDLPEEYLTALGV